MSTGPAHPRSNRLIMIRPALVVKIYRQPWRLANERSAIGAARSRARVPNLLWCSARPAAYAVFRYLPGPTLADVHGSGSLGEVLDYLDQVHATPGHQFGRAAGPWFDSWAHYLQDRLEHYRAALLTHGQLAAAAVAAALMRRPVSMPSTPRLIHNDPNPDNFIRSRGKLVGVDWELAAFGDPALDTARAAWEWGIEDQDLSALAASRGIDAELLRYYQSLHALGRLMGATAPLNPDATLARRCLDTLASSPWPGPSTVRRANR